MKALAILLCLVALPLSLSAQNQQEPPISSTPLTADEIAIYHAFLSTYSTGLKATINLSDVTDPFTPDDMDIKGCLKNFDSATAPAETHRFTTEFSNLHNFRLVDPKTHRISDPGDAIRNGSSVDDAVTAGFKAGVLTLSEIRFDSGHKMAAFSYSFHCGSLCGNGATLIFSLRDGKWVLSKRQCARWIS